MQSYFYTTAYLCIYGSQFCLTQDVTSMKPIGVGEQRNEVYYLKECAEGKTFIATQQDYGI